MSQPYQGHTRDLLLDGAKASPVMAYFGAIFGGMSVSDWASLAALIYTLFLIADKLKSWGVFRFLRRRWLWLIGRPAQGGRSNG